MTDQAFRIYEQALSEQHSRNEARRIRTRVSEARGRPHAAGVRWPFELMQNALDSGPRQGNESVAIRIRRQPSGVVFEHDGAPFTSVELAALLSGGSSKDFESDVTTGRFGTGFLVTHVLAERVRLQGLLDVGDHFEQFHLVLDRSGNEENILQNIFACNAAIRAATSLEANPRVQSATFEYSIPEGSTTFTAGFEALTRALPYLYGTRPTLGRIEIESEDGCIEIWSSDPLASQSFREGYLQCRSITIERSRAPTRKLDVFRFMTTPEAHAAALLAVEHVGGAPTVLVPDLQTPRVFRDYPLRGATFVPLNFILDGKFEPDQERSGLLMGDKDKALLQDALNAAVLGVRYALERCWSGMHLLASTRVPSTVFDPSSGERFFIQPRHRIIE